MAPLAQCTLHISIKQNLEIKFRLSSVLKVKALIPVVSRTVSDLNSYDHRLKKKIEQMKWVFRRSIKNCVNDRAHNLFEDSTAVFRV